MFSKIKEKDEKMEKFETDKKSTVPSVLSADLSVVGDLVCTGEVQIDGKIEGDIRCRMLIVGLNAEIHGSIQADFIKVYGNVKGQLCARSVFLAGSARVVGDITHETLEMESGAFLEGACRHTDDPIPAEQAPADLMLTDARNDSGKSENTKK